MSPSYLLAVLPPPELAERIQNFRSTHNLKDAAAVPHITVKARSGLSPEALDWQDALRGVVGQHSPFMLEIGGPRLFRNGTALYLEARSPEAVRLHLALLDALKPAKFFGYEGAALKLHLSLALARRGVELPELLTAAQAEFADLEREPLVFTAHTLTPMRKPGPGGFYAPLEEWSLLGRSPAGATPQ
ncbi:2'-5' RNA ligase family protein [Deinococcus arenicola]|uniref:2'-5' RNA ligase family protein n=1 Tax=Deinococcus arenicola TaxID=2994950 RepID=A0ABU4DNI8_9DEIO|nr:2'-5' RNA ligase family protein [Deinococcus sp. ZS9-10]MDV6373522.1 2'-5' RNA ligase family protein [Deinococcus sp. ZS9-10]